MPEKVLFRRFKAKESDRGLVFEIKHRPESWPVCAPAIAHRCRPRRSIHEIHSPRAKLIEHGMSRARRGARETLDFFERLYQDLYGGD